MTENVRTVASIKGQLSKFSGIIARGLEGEAEAGQGDDLRDPGVEEHCTSAMRACFPLRPAFPPS